MRPENAHEFQHRYGGTYIGVNNITGDGKLTPVYVESVDSRHQFRGMPISDEYNGNVTLHWRDAVFTYPKLGMINVNGAAFHITRRIQRGYKRGLLPDRINIKTVGAYGSQIGVAPQRTDSAVLREIFSPTYTSLEVAATGILEGDMVGGAFTDKHALALVEGYNDPILFYGEHTAGFFRDGVLYLPQTYDFVAEELRSKGYETEVIDNA